MEMKAACRFIAASLAVAAVFPCSVDTSPLFFPWHVPEKFDSAFVRGQLGIVPPTLSPRYKLIAWRYIAGLPLDPQEQAAVLPPPATISSRLPTYSQSTYSTGKASRAEQGAFYENCLPDAFSTAARTRADRQQSYANEALLAGWVKAQSQVFENCAGEKAVYPADPDPSSIPLVRADRQYQIAAAHFYAEDFEDAEQRFRLISTDDSSPWRETAAYMVVRTLIREDSLLHKQNALAEAKAQLQRIADGPFYDSAQGLIRYIDSLVDPASTLKLLAQRLAVLHSGTAFARALGEGTFVLTGNRFSAVLANPDLPEPFDWVGALDSKKSDYSIKRWRETHSTLWLTAALMQATSKDQSSTDLISAGLAVPESSPAFDTVVFHSIRLMVESGRRTEARRRLNALLAGKPGRLDSTTNALRGQRMYLATSFDDLLRWATRRAIGMGQEAYDTGVTVNGPMLDGDSIGVLNAFTPLPKLVEAAQSRHLPGPVRKEIAIAAWTRAVVLGADHLADRLTPILAEANPAWASELEAFRTLQGEQKRFAGALFLARHSDFAPDVEWTFPTGVTWWCAEPLSPRGPAVRPDAVFSAAERAQASRELRQLHSAGAAQAFLAPIIMAWARSNPDDARTPEALHRLVRITRYGCRAGDDNGRISKGAFELLHKRYATSTWARQTPYWFDK